MDEVAIHYKTHDSEANESRYGLDTDEIRLRNRGITEIDLTSVSLLPELRVIDLVGNAIRHLNLSPLGHCTHLRSLLLERNEIESLDISPLSSLTRFDFLTLEQNKLEEINLSPLYRIPHINLVVTYDEDVYIILDDEILQWEPYDFSLKISMILREILAKYRR
ncbi:MAG: hypothetical protein ACFFED_07650 [Candidatus Thorarchaeota archaeon]